MTTIRRVSGLYRSLAGPLALPLALVSGTASLASANAFNISEHDAEATGRGNAVAASDTGPSSIVFNPGGIAVGDGVNVAVNGSLVAAGGQYKNDTDGTVKTDGGPAVVPAAFVTARVHPMVAVGLGFHAPFGLSISWPTNHPQADVIQDQSLRTYYLSGVVGVNLDRQVPGLSIGGGIDLVPATVELEQQIRFGDVTGNAHLGGDAFGIGGRAGVMYRSPDLPLKIGAMWSSQVKLDFSGTGDFDAPQPFRGQLPPDGEITTTIKMPMSISGGVAYGITPDLEVEADARWLDWSTFRELRIDLPGGSQSVVSEQYKDTVSVKLGAAYALPTVPLALRVGYIYDPTPIPATTLSAQLPDANRNDLTLGGSYRFGDYGLHASVLYVLPATRQTSDVPLMPQYKAEYKVTALVASVMVTGHFGGK